jgi:hypothetical protein
MTAIVALMMGPLRELNALTHLDDGWRFGDGLRPSSTAHMHATALTLAAADAGATKFEYFPEEDGGILTIAYRGNQSAEILAKASGGFEMAFEDENGLSPITEFASLRQVQQELEAHGWQLQKSSDSFTRVISASERTVIRPWRFDLAGAVYRSSTQGASLQKGIRFVPIQNGTIPDAFADHQPSSGVSERRNLLQAAS